VIATGTAPHVPGPFAKLPPELLLSNESVFELADLPASVLIVGAGPIGLELGQALHRLGVRVTIAGTRGAVGPLRDPRVKAAALAALCGELELHTDYVAGEIAAGGDGVTMRYICDGEHRSGTWARVLLAAGRKSLLGELGLEHAGVVLDGKGRPQGFDAQTLRIGETNVFLAGDVSGLRPLLHEASDEGHIAGGNAARLPDGVQPQPRRTKLGVVFTDPGMAVVGDGFEGVTPETHAVGEVDWSRQGRARVLRKNYGVSRIYATRSDRKLHGAELAGPGAEHMAHLLAWAVQQGLTVDDALRMPFYHPVLEEGLRTALQALKADLGKVV
ncbi:MAG TPA: FAD-dependent oxidoreductase, partial [Nannocystis sp.]